MSVQINVVFADLERAISVRDPSLGALLVRYLEQEDPEAGHSEAERDDTERDEAGQNAAMEDEPPVVVPPGAMTIEALTTAVSVYQLQRKTPTERKVARLEAFALAERSAFAPPRLRVGQLLLDLYARGEAADRAALIEVFAHGRLQWGMWKAVKAIYKLAEANHDLALFGVLAYRFDVLSTTPQREIGPGTHKYLRRRAWRFLRHLGAATPEAYVAFAVEVLRHYPARLSDHTQVVVAAHIWAHEAAATARSLSFAPPSSLDQRAFAAAWKISPAPLLRLLEVAVNDRVCDFAIRSLRADHPLALRAVEPAWLARLARRPIAAIHTFVVTLLRESPEFHQSRLAELGLREVVLELLSSGSREARAYALEYAAAHAPDLPVARLVTLVETGADEVVKFAAARLEALTPESLGLPTLLRLLGVAATPWASVKLNQGFAAQTVDVTAFVDTAVRGTNQYNAIIKFFNDKQAGLPEGYFTALIDDPRVHERALRSVLAAALISLSKATAQDIGIAWIQRALEDRRTSAAVAKWLEDGMLSGPELDVEWLKNLVGKPRLRPIALRLLADRRHVAPARIGLDWLLDLARAPDAELARFAERMLLENFEPKDFAVRDFAARDFAVRNATSDVATRDAASNEAGVTRLWQLASGKQSPEPVRLFAATYLKAHHPVLGLRLAEAKALGITPRLTHDAYPLATLRPLLFDPRADVRRLAAAVAAAEIVRWGDRVLVYELAGANEREPRALGAGLLLAAIADDAARDAATLPVDIPQDWIDGTRLFALAESSHKAARELALTLIRKQYDSVGGAQRLAWLMESPQRDVRLFAVRLFWDRHRPKPWPDDYVPRQAATAALATQRFADVAALREFARTVLFGLPPGRVAPSDPVAEGGAKPERALPASIAKKRLIETLRDVGLEDVELANALAPVLREFTASNAKGEWQASVQALVALKARHGAAFTEVAA